MIDSCGGCQYHEYPYKAQVPISGFGFKEFTCDDDVWEIIDLLIQEVIENNAKGGRDFDITSSIKAQIPFFACKNIIFDSSMQKDIQRYVYCKELSVSPYKGTYEEHPAVWVDRFFIIKNCLAKMENNEIKKSRNK